MRPTKKVWHLIDSLSIEYKELYELLELMRILKEADYDNVKFHMLQDASIALLYDAPWDGASWEAAAADLGAQAVRVDVLGGLCDQITALSQTYRAVVVSTEQVDALQQAEQVAGAPIIRAGSVLNPVMGIADLFTMGELLPAGRALDRMRIAFAGNGKSATARELMHSTTTLGCELRIYTPECCTPNELYIERLQDLRHMGSGRLFCTTDAKEAFIDADFIVTGAWEVEEGSAQYAALADGFCVDAALLSHAEETCRVLHRLPLRRGVEITEEVADNPERCVWMQQAENRLHAERAVLARYVMPTLPFTLDAQVQKHTNALNMLLETLDVW